MPEDKPEDKQTPPPQLPKPGNAPKPKDSSVREYGDGSCTVNIKSDKD